MWRNGAQCGALQLPLPVVWVQTSLGEDFFYKNVMILSSQRCNIARPRARHHIRSLYPHIHHLTLV